MTLMIAENDSLHRAFAIRLASDIWHAPVDIVEVDDGRQAIEIALKEKVRYAILDLQLPNASGIDVARALWEKTRDVQIVFWSNYTDEAYVRHLARIVPAGAQYGYVLKSAPEAAMRTALESVFFKDREAIDHEVRQVQHRVTNRLAGLSDTEYEGLIDVALGLTDQMIAERRRLSVRGVQSRLRHLYEKLEVAPFGPTAKASARYNSRTRAITFAFQRGLINFEVLRAEQAKFDRWLDGTRKRAPARSV